MEWNDRMAQVRRAAGLTQEQLGELVGVTRQAVSKWEAGQAVPDALTVAKLCQALHVSTDYILLGTDPEDGVPEGTPLPEPELPDFCPCCGRPVAGTLCPVCGYTLPTTPPRGPRYALIMERTPLTKQEDNAAQLTKYCGLPEEKSLAILKTAETTYADMVLGRDLTDSAVVWMASHLDRDAFGLRIVEDCGEEDEELRHKPKAMEAPASVVPDKGGLGFWGVVGAVIVALLILSLF